MDSVSQFVLGASVVMAVRGRRSPLWQSALCGGLIATLPDLDVFIDHGDAISNMTLHRTESHSLFWLTLISPLAGWLIARVVRQKTSWHSWWLAVWLALITHPLLDLMTVYGTQLAIPFSHFPWAVGSVYIVDPLYTLPLMIGLAIALWRQRTSWNQLGLLLSTLYLAWSVVAQGIAGHQVNRELAHQQIEHQQVLVTPTPFNTLVWRVVIMTPERYGEAWVSLLSPQRPLQVHWHSRHAELYRPLQNDRWVKRVAWFSHGFFAMQQRQDGTLTISDLRMGENESYTFTFNLGSATARNPHPSREPSSRDSLATSFQQLWQRL